MIKPLALLAVGFLMSVSPTRAQETPVYPIPFMPENVSKTHLVHYVAPVYPVDAKRKCVQGDVVLELIVSETGAIAHVNILDGPDVLTAAATFAAKQWGYEPYLINGSPTKYKTRATVSFRTAQGKCRLSADNPTLTGCTGSAFSRRGARARTG